MAPRNPPWTMPAGLAKRSSARIRHTVRPGTALSTQVMPRVSSQLGGTWIRGSATRVTIPAAARHRPRSGDTGAMAIDAHDGPAPVRPGGRGHRGLGRGRPLPRVLGGGRPRRLRRHQPGAGGAVPAAAPRRARHPAGAARPVGAARACPTRPPARRCWPRSWCSSRRSRSPPSPDATSELYHVLVGTGRTEFEPGRPSGGRPRRRHHRLGPRRLRDPAGRAAPPSTPRRRGDAPCSTG